MEGKTKASQAALACASEATRKLNPHLFQRNDPSCCSSDPVLDKVAAPLLIVKPSAGTVIAEKARVRCNKLSTEDRTKLTDIGMQIIYGKKRIRQDKPMNKLEQEAFDYIMSTILGDAGEQYSCVRAQSKRFRLASGLWYKPDVTARGPYRGCIIEHAWEVKGPHAFRGGFENLKMAATQYPEIRWILMWKDGGQWQFQEVLP